MAEEVHIAVFDGGELHKPPRLRKGGEAVLALPLNRLLAKVVRVGADDAEGLSAVAERELKAMSPYPDEPLAVSCEVLKEDAEGTLALALALPESSADDIGEALDAGKVGITRVDALVLGLLRSAYNELSGDGRKVVLSQEGDCVALVVLDGQTPCALRALSPDSEIKAELAYSLLEAEASGGPAPLSEILVSGDVNTEGLEDFAPVRALVADAADAVRGVAERSAEQGTANALPQTWLEILEETRFKRKMVVGFGAAAFLWVAALSVMLGVTWWTNRQADQVELARRAHRSAYNKVSDRKAQVETVRSVSNHDLGALETLRVVSGVLPEGVELSKWYFKRGERLSFTGTAEGSDNVVESNQRVFALKDALAGFQLGEISGNDEDADVPFFTDVSLPKGVVQRSGKAVFDVECSFKTVEEAE